VKSYILDDRTGGFGNRFAEHRALDEFLLRPYDIEEAAEYDADLHAAKNVQAAEAMSMGGEDDPFMAQPVNR
jgi:hypothetical protein